MDSPLRCPWSRKFVCFNFFSVCGSLTNNVSVGKNSSFIQPPFLNLMANIAQRAGSVRVRTGGNTQDFASFAEDIPNANGKNIAKQDVDSNNPVGCAALPLVLAR